MNERSEPYIGISGVVHPEQQYQLVNEFTQLGLDALPANRRLALGVKAVHKTQYLDIQNKYGSDWFPIGEEGFSQALKPDDTSLRVAQIYFDHEYVHDAQYRNQFTQRICRRGAAWLNALQFDLLPWESDATMLPFLEQLKKSTGMNILLQVHSDAMNKLGPTGVVTTLSAYADSVDYVLFDASHGKGVRLDMDGLMPFIDAAYSSNQLKATGIGLAGGLNAAVVEEELPKIIATYSDVSWDAEGQLHPVQLNGTRPVDMDSAKQYLKASAQVLKGV